MQQNILPAINTRAREAESHQVRSQLCRLARNHTEERKLWDFKRLCTECKEKYDRYIEKFEAGHIRTAERLDSMVTALKARLKRETSRIFRGHKYLWRRLVDQIKGWGEFGTIALARRVATY